MMKMYIDGNLVGNCKHYCQYRNVNGARKELEIGWTFYMENGMEIKIPCSAIRFFDSCGKINIYLYE